MHRFDRYLQATGHYPRFRRKMGAPKRKAHQLEVTIAPTYITIRTDLTSDPLRIPRSQLVAMLKWAIPLIKQMESAPSRQFDPEAAMAEYLEAEESHARELRALKRELYGRRRSKRRGTKGRKRPRA